MAEIIFTDENFQAEVMESDIPVLVDFYADWCGPCKMMAPMIEQLAEEYAGKVKIGKINAEDNPDTAEKFDIMSIPTFVFIKNGEMVESMTGGTTKQVLAQKLDAML